MRFTAHVFGKTGCSKCAVLLKRLEALVARPEYSMFDVAYHNVMTDSGIVEFCKAGCLNPNRIPALLISEQGAPSGVYMFEPRQLIHDPEYDYRAGTTFQWVGLQTDYDSGHGILTPAMVEGVLKRTLQLFGECPDGEVFCAVEKEDACQDDGFCSSCMM